MWSTMNGHYGAKRAANHNDMYIITVRPCVLSEYTDDGHMTLILAIIVPLEFSIFRLPRVLINNYRLIL